MGLIGGFCHLYIGQEAVVTGIQMAREAGGSSHHRLSRPWAHARLRYRPQGHHGRVDRPPPRLFQRQRRLDAHVLGAKNFYGGHGIVGAPVPLGTGLAFANKYRGNDRVCLTLFRRRRGQSGPGLRELQHGIAVEAADRLRHREQPIRHGHVGAAGSALAEELYHRGSVFRIPGMKVNGMDVRAVKSAAEAALAKVRSGGGPMMLEMNTYRYRGHSMSDPAKYRSREEVQDVREKRDPIELIAKRLTESGVTDDER